MISFDLANQTVRGGILDLRGNIAARVEKPLNGRSGTEVVDFIYQLIDDLLAQTKIPIFGDGFGAGEIGHVTIMRDGERCVCGNIGCLETAVSRRVLFQEATRIMNNNPHSSLHQFITTAADFTTANIIKAYAVGEADLHQLATEMGEHLGFAVAGLVGSLNIQTILVSGNMSCFGAPLLASMRQAMNKYALPKLTKATEIQFGSLDQDSVIQGAAALILAGELGLI